MNSWDPDGWDVDEDGTWGYSTPGAPRPTPRRDPAIPRRNALPQSTPTKETP